MSTTANAVGRLYESCTKWGYVVEFTKARKTSTGGFAVTVRVKVDRGRQLEYTRGGMGPNKKAAKHVAAASMLRCLKDYRKSFKDKHAAEAASAYTGGSGGDGGRGTLLPPLFSSAAPAMPPRTVDHPHRAVPSSDARAPVRSPSPPPAYTSTHDYLRPPAPKHAPAPAPAPVPAITVDAAPPRMHPRPRPRDVVIVDEARIALDGHVFAAGDVAMRPRTWFGARPRHMYPTGVTFVDLPTDTDDAMDIALALLVGAEAGGLAAVGGGRVTVVSDAVKTRAMLEAAVALFPRTVSFALYHGAQ